MSTTTPSLLFVEGPDDVHVVCQLLNDHGLTRLRDRHDKRIRPLKLFFEKKTLDIDYVADENNVVAHFETVLELANERPNAVGLILDFDSPNDAQANNRNIAVRNVIQYLQGKDCHWNLSDDFQILSDKGFIAEPTDKDTPRIGVWFMPNNRDRGMLETFLQELIPDGRSNLLAHARQSTITAKETHDAPFLPVHQDKAVVHAFLAWMNKPGRPFGVSFQNGSFDPKAELACRFVDWVKMLFR